MIVLNYEIRVEDDNYFNINLSGITIVIIKDYEILNNINASKWSKLRSFAGHYYIGQCFYKITGLHLH